MDHFIFNEKFIGLSDGTSTVIADLVAASSEDVPYYNTVSGRELAPGSVALVPSEGKLYILDADLLWTEWSSGEKLPAPEDEDDDDDDEGEQDA